MNQIKTINPTLSYIPKTKVTTFYNQTYNIMKTNRYNSFTLNKLTNIQKNSTSTQTNLRNPMKVHAITFSHKSATPAIQNDTLKQKFNEKNLSKDKKTSNPELIDKNHKIEIDTEIQKTKDINQKSAENTKFLKGWLEKTIIDKSKIQHKETIHQIITEGLPTHAKTRILPPEKLTEAKKIFDDMVNKGIIRSSDSNWSSPLLMKLKSDKTWRCCGDYRRLNAITKKDEYPVPLIRDITTRLAEAKFFTKLDLEKAYYQIKMAEEDIKKQQY